jgi:hypothetical protein
MFEINQLAFWVLVSVIGEFDLHDLGRCGAQVLGAALNDPRWKKGEAARQCRCDDVTVRRGVREGGW